MSDISFNNQTLEPLNLWVREDGDLWDFTTGFTFSLVVGDGVGPSTGFTTAVGFTGAAGSGLPPNGTPNLVKQWATTGELLPMTNGTLYNAVLTFTRTSDGRYGVRKFKIRIPD